MTGTLLTQPVIRAVDASGSPIPGARLQFYVTGTTTPTPVYAGASLATPLANPVTADSGGLFAPIFLDPTVIYRTQLLTSAGSLIQDVDPVNGPIVNAAGSIAAAMIQGGAAIANLGFTPLNRAGDTATNLTLACTAPSATSAGYLGAPRNEQDANYALALSDCGKLVRCNSASAVTYQLPPQAIVAWPDGAVIMVRNAGAGVLTVQRGAGVILTLAGANTNKDCAIAPYGLASLIHEFPNDTWTISGVGIS
jgi:hypothetical protein